MGIRGVIGDKWSMRILWVCAIGSAISLYMVAVERQKQNRDQMMAESLKAMESEGSADENLKTDDESSWKKKDKRSRVPCAINLVHLSIA